MKKYAVNIITDGNVNSYGYWTGKDYIFEGSYYPCFTDNIEEAKLYTSKRRAENAGVNCINKYGYVIKFEIKEIEKGEN